MAYIRSPHTELTGCQERAPYSPMIDLRCDFVMVYGIDPSMPERVRAFREQGYVVHLMTGISWGEYQDYLDGDWDGKKHWDEAQRSRDNREVSHNPTVPYMCPTLAFADYLIENKGNGIHHISMQVSNYDDVVYNMKKLGYRRLANVQTAVSKHVKDVRSITYDLRDRLGVIIEFTDKSVGVLSRNPRY